ncbi:MAG: hypothetical protein EBZ48_04330 [Proteobacteria bacterium]|nr:hypothetical protein [Pseudomonadota bacterium]
MIQNKISDYLALTCLTTVTLILFARPTEWIAWFPHDYGLLSWSAEQVLLGKRPHVDFVDTYSGLLSYLNAGAFLLFGIRLSSLHLIFIPALVIFTWSFYCLLRRTLSPRAATLGTFLALMLGPQAYLAPMPSWYLLILTTVQLFFIARFLDTGHQRYLFLAGFAGGISIAIKITAVFPNLAMLAWLCAVKRESDAYPLITKIVLIGTGAVCLIPVLMLGFDSQLVSHGIPIILAIAALLYAPVASIGPSSRVKIGFFLLGIFFGLLPLICHYHPADIPKLINGLFVLPGRRLNFAHSDTPSLWGICGVPGIAWALCGKRKISSVLTYQVTIIVICLLGASQLNRLNFTAPLFFLPLVLAGSFLVRSGRIYEGDPSKPAISQLAGLLVSVAVLSSLVQIPFFLPIYLYYSFPLILLALITLHGPDRAVSPIMQTSVVLVMLYFAVGSDTTFRLRMHGLAENARPVGTPRGDIRFLRDDADSLDPLLKKIRAVKGGLYAGPDMPHVYFLSGVNNPLSSPYEFFGEETSYRELAEGIRDGGIRVVVLNKKETFSSSPPDWFVNLLPDTLKTQESFGYLRVYTGAK